MKRIFLLLLLLSAYNMMMMASITQQVDTIYEDPTCLYDCGYEMIEEVYEEKRRLFLAALFEELVTRHPAECKSMQDSVYINFIVNKSGKIDSVWLAKPTSAHIESAFRFIKNYDFKGPVIEYHSNPPGQYVFPYLIKLILRAKPSVENLFIRFRLESMRRPPRRTK